MSRSRPWARRSLLALVVLSASACVSTEFQTDKMHVTRTSVFSDVQVEATMAADGSITVKERQAQTATEALIERIPVVAP